MATINDLKTKANLVANATEVGENTAERVGGALQDAASLIAALITRAEGHDTKDTQHEVRMGDIETSITNLTKAIAKEVADRQNALTAEGQTRHEADEAMQTAITNIQRTLSTMTGADTSQAIENFQEVIEFLAGIKDEETLTALLDAINVRITALEGKSEIIFVRSWETDDLEQVCDSFSSAGKYFLEPAGGSLYMTVKSEDEPHLAYVNGAGLALREMEFQRNVLYINTDEKRIQYWSGSSLVEFIIQKYEDFMGTKGMADGLAPLNWLKQIPSEFLPDSVYDVRMCSKWDNTVTDGGLASGYGSESYAYNPDTKKCFKSVYKAGSTPDGTTYKGYFWTEEDMSTARIYVNCIENVPYRWTGSDLAALAPKNTPASIFNATTEVPLQGAYYTLYDPENTELSAVHAALSAGKAVKGLILSFQKSESVWKTYQYIGKTTADTNFLNPDNWKDFGSLASGSEAMIDIDRLVPLSTGFYTLGTALNALKKYQEDTAVDYRKRGLVISYSTASNVVETKQFQGDNAITDDFWQDGLWKEFGGSSKVETKDEPQAEGKDALSTGGAYNAIPTDINAEVDGTTLKLNLVRADGEQVGDGKQVTLPSGGGTLTGTVVSIAYKESPLYTKAGGSVVIEAAIRSVTTQGQVETENNIEKLELIDRDTNQTLETLTVNKASSASLTTYDYLIDVSSYFVTAGKRRFRIIATDDGGNTGSRNINVTAVDVTIQSVQTLNYTKTTALVVGGGSKTLPMYKFPNNASDKGILATTEIYIDNKWQVLGEATVMDTYSHSVTIDPAKCLGKSLSHGAYAIRIHGVDVGSGVVGNYLHTAVMVVEEGNTAPIVVSRWYTDDVTGQKKLYETINVDYAVYDPQNAEPEAMVYEGADLVAERVAYRSQTYTYTHKVTDVAFDGSVTISVVVRSGSSASQEADFVISGTLLAIEEVKTQRQFSLDFSSRSNTEADHSIKDGAVTMDVEGVNWSTNGFVADNFGTNKADGNMALRMAENASGVLHYKPFADAAIETTGMAIQFTVMKKNIANEDYRLMSCIKNGFGFWVDGNNVVFTFDNNATVEHSIVAALDDSETTNVAIVIEPAAFAPYTGIGVAKMYFDGEEIGACYYEENSIIPHDEEVSWQSAEGDMYLYNIKAWKTYFGFEQEFHNYLLTMTDTEAMITEYNFNQVMSSVTAENTTKNRPIAQKLYDIGIPYFVVCKNPDTAENDAKDNYPEYLETLDGDKKTTRVLDVYAYFPDRPWQDFKAVAAVCSNQGTTSSKRPIKNFKMKFKKAQAIELLHKESEFSGEELEKFKRCEANAAEKRVQVLETSLPTNIITVKVDYSESGGANNGASTNLYNDLQRALGAGYITPAQKVYNASGTGYIINTSIASVPCAFFRTDKYSPDATSPSHGYFHAKGNWNEDKGDAKVYGFEGVKGYNKETLSYGSFIELVADRDETLDHFAGRVDKKDWVQLNEDGAENVYVLSEFCGPNHKIYRYRDNAWTETTGNMKYVANKWVFTGDVVNPVECYELLKYDALDWFQGVDSVDDMLTLDTDGKPIWLQYFESRYPDDDNLNALYEKGKKVPYNLYNWLRFCQDCNHHLTESKGQISLGGEMVAGTKANRLKKWQQELHTIANVRSILCYHVFTDYIAAVDQRSKNMMLGFYLDEDGVERVYMNHLYDGDTIMGSDNDCGLTIPALVDPNDDDAGIYQGHDSVMFIQTAKLGTGAFWLNDDGSETITTRAVAQAMRSVVLSDGLVPFSYAGIIKYWVTDRLSKWPKLVSSFDGERKYIENSKSTANYFFALHGLSIQRLKDFVKTRFLFRDGFYQTGDLYSSMVSMRATGTNVTIKITAAKQGYFGIGVDRANTATDSCYLKAGESYTLKSGMTNTGSGTMLYIFGANRLEKLDISGATPSSQSWDISELTLVKELIIGGEYYNPSNNNEGYLTNLDLGSLPFLESLDIQNTYVTNVNARYCPRLKTVLAKGSKLVRIQLAEASGLTSLQVPSTYKNLTLRYLPSLTNSGLVFESAASVETLVVEGCAKIDAWALLTRLAKASKTNLKYVRVTDVDVNGNGSDLTTLAGLGLQGVDATLAVVTTPNITGRYQLTTYTEDEVMDGWRAALPLLDIDQQAYSDYKEYDNETDPENVTNTDNSTGYDFKNDYEPSGHILKIRAKSVPVKGKLNDAGKMVMTKMSETDYTKLATGEDFDNRDSLGEMYDCFMFIPHFWYKGINDFKTQEKHTLLSSNKEEPRATWKVKKEANLSDILYADIKGIVANNVTVGSTFGDDCLGDLTSCAVYRLDVEGMKQARYIGLNNASYCAVFVNSDGKILEKDVLAISGLSGSPVDFSNEQGDYVYRSVPTGSKYLYFTCMRGLSDEDHPVFAVDSADIEAIEPGWVEHKAELIGIYEGTIDDLGRWRSVSGRRTQRGNGTSTTSTEWLYDKEGNPTNMPVGSINYTYQDMLNLARYRGKGYHSISYEQSKIIALLSRCWYGNRDDQRIYGFGNSADYTTGTKDRMGKADTSYLIDTGVNKVWGIEGFIACTYEVMDFVGVNVSTFAEWKALKRTDNDTSMPIDAKYHIFDPRTNTERVVQGLKEVSGNNIVRLKHGKYCDYIASAVTTDKSAYSTGYGAGVWYTAGRGRCVGRANNFANASGGLVCANAYVASSNSYAGDGARLAFSGELANESEIDKDA